MKTKNDRIVYKVRSEQGSEYESVRDEILRISGAFSTLEQLKLQDVKWLSTKGLDATGRLVILSQILLPQLCSIIERGLTLEEIGFLVGLDQNGLKSVLKKPAIKRAVIIMPGKVEKTQFVKIMVPLKTTKQNADGEIIEKPVKEPLLAPKRLVDEIRRTGYITKEGRLLRRGYISPVSGPLPTVYVFQNSREVAEEAMGEGWKAKTEERMADDQEVIKAKLEIAIAVLELLKPLFSSEYAPIIVDQLAQFFFATYDNAVHYAWRYRALNDKDTFDEIEFLVRPLLCAADSLGKSDWIKNQESREQVVEAIDKVISEFKAVIDGRALLLPEAVSELSRG